MKKNSIIYIRVCSWVRVMNITKSKCKPTTLCTLRPDSRQLWLAGCIRTTSEATTLALIAWGYDSPFCRLRWFNEDLNLGTHGPVQTGVPSLNHWATEAAWLLNEMVTLFCTYNVWHIIKIFWLPLYFSPPKYIICWHRVTPITWLSSRRITNVELSIRQHTTLNLAACQGETSKITFYFYLKYL